MEKDLKKKEKEKATIVYQINMHVIKYCFIPFAME